MKTINVITKQIVANIKNITDAPTPSKKGTYDYDYNYGEPTQES